MTPPPVPIQTDPADDVMIYMTREEYDAARARALAELGLTYDQLADQARRRDFLNGRARELWVIIGEAED